MKHIKAIPTTIKTKMKRTLTTFPLTFGKYLEELPESHSIWLYFAEMTNSLLSSFVE